MPKPMIINCSDALGYFRVIESFQSRGWAFRGHSRCSQSSSEDWKLESTLHRFLMPGGSKIMRQNRWYAHERSQLARFRSTAHLYSENASVDDVECLGLIRHYGGITRLLDFTYNPGVALYFAIRGAAYTTGAFSVHALKISDVGVAARSLRRDLPEYQNVASNDVPINPRVSEYRIGDNPSQVDFVGFYDGSRINLRQEAQEGLYLVPSRIDLNIEEWLVDNLSGNDEGDVNKASWIELVFSEIGSYAKTSNQLTKMGMTARRLFPGLEGVCESMRFSWVDPPNGLEATNED